MAKILFFNPPSRKNVYLNTNVKVGAPSYPSLTLATLAGGLVRKHMVRIYDFDLDKNSPEKLFQEIKLFKPDIIASSAKTPDYLSVVEIMTEIKKKFPKIQTIVGGVHVTAMPEEAIRTKCFDIIVLGEGDGVISEILSGTPLKNVLGIGYRTLSGKVVFTGRRNMIKNIDSLSYPAWRLFKLDKYKNSRLSSRTNPVGLIETSRGCSYKCNFCSKLIFGTYYRTKSVKRVVNEMEYMLDCGFREIHISDDSFTQNIDRAKDVCREIIKRKLKFNWSLINGIRVNFVDEEFFHLAKKAGCWQTGFGIESGDQKVLNKIGKGTTLRQIVKAVKGAKKERIETFGFFIFGLSGENENSLKKTIQFSKAIPLDIAKFDICIPYPGTEYYKDLDAQGKILTKEWDRYLCHQVEKPLFVHSTLKWNVIQKYYHKAFREYYLRPSYILNRMLRDILRGDLFYDLKYFLQTKW